MNAEFFDLFHLYKKNQAGFAPPLIRMNNVLYAQSLRGGQTTPTKAVLQPHHVLAHHLITTTEHYAVQTCGGERNVFTVKFYN